MAKKNAPNNKTEWIAYYEAIKNGNVGDIFKGSCKRLESGKTMTPICGYYNKTEKQIKKSHPWFIDKKSKWGETFKKNLGPEDAVEVIKKYKETTRKNLIDDDMRNYTDLTPHHLISCEVTKAIHSHWKNIIEEHIGYNVNCSENLLLLTNIADVACYLSVPLHEGNHDYGEKLSIEESDLYAKIKISTNNIGKSLWNFNDTVSLKGYHSKVFKLLTKTLTNHFGKCADIKAMKFIEDMNLLSRYILIKLKNGSMTLSEHGKDYLPGKGNPGCRNVRAITAYFPQGNKKSEFNKDINVSCDLKRNHDYLEYLFITSETDVETRKKIGFVVSSKLKLNFE